MESAGDLVARTRKDANLSMHALAERAGVAYTTVFRIEHGKVDPTTGTLARLLAAAGWSLELSARDPAVPQLADLNDAWSVSALDGDTPDWTRLRGFLDLLAQYPTMKRQTTLQAPPPSGSPLMDNLLAAIAEKVCDDAGLPRPEWTAKVAPLEEPWSSGGTPRMRARIAAATPAQLAARGILVDQESLWREPETIGL
jgi:transcriptional regulator with XRE-family HTH domain